MNINKKAVSASLLAIGLTVGAAGYAGAEEQPPAEAVAHSDPLESINRPIWDFNYKVLDKHVLRPVAVFYRNNVPDPAKTGIYNFVSNLEEPSSAVNNLLQGKFAYAANATGRFLVNSTLGIFGLFDMAETMGMERKQDEFGEVLATWGVGDGPFLMVPALGPSTVRNEVGDLVDSAYFPLEAISFWQSLGLSAIKGIHMRAEFLEQENLLENSLDSYTFVKDAYYQARRNAIYDGHPPEPANNDAFDDEEFEDID